MSEPELFSPIRVSGLKLTNRIVIAPMCQYVARDGCMNEWHLIHLGQLSVSGAALLTIESTAVSEDGRITYADVGLYNDETESAMKGVVEPIRRWSNMPIGIQISHAGRKASTETPWKGGRQLSPENPLGWHTVAPSPLPHKQGDTPPSALDKDGLQRVREAFAATATRAARLGLDLLQVQAAHGYLLHEFLSPLSNHREDEYGGSLENRMRFPLEVFEGVRKAFPKERPVSVRVSGTDWVPGGWDISQTVKFAQALEKLGCSAINVSSGGNDPAQRIPVAPGYQVPLARAVKAAVQIPTVTAGFITGSQHAESIILKGDADMIAVARLILDDPQWPWHAAAELGASVQTIPPYLRTQPSQDFGFMDGE
jgi:2,4-dienoyl-CoA reductase-like NADH-dependent reductase (Old Yellow Enzyme family)